MVLCECSRYAVHFFVDVILIFVFVGIILTSRYQQQQWARDNPLGGHRNETGLRYSARVLPCLIPGNKFQDKVDMVDEVERLVWLEDNRCCILTFQRLMLMMVRLSLFSNKRFSLFLTSNTLEERGERDEYEVVERYGWVGTVGIQTAMARAPSSVTKLLMMSQKDRALSSGMTSGPGDLLCAILFKS